MVLHRLRCDIGIAEKVSRARSLGVADCPGRSESAWRRRDEPVRPGAAKSTRNRIHLWWNRRAAVPPRESDHGGSHRGGGIAILVVLGNESQTICIYGGPGLIRPLTIGLGFAVLLLAATAFENRGGIGIVGRLKVLGDMSYSVYLCHVLVLAVTGRVWLLLSAHVGNNAVIVAVWWVITLAAVLAVGYLSYRLIVRPVMVLSRRWRARLFREPQLTRPATFVE